MNARVDAALRRTPAQPVFRWRASRRLAVLAYHQVEDVERFEAQLDAIRHEWHAVRLDDVLASIRGRAALPRRAVLITFDDADRSLLERGVPLLRERGLPAVAFVVTGLLGTDRGIWTHEAAELVRAGGTTSVVDATGQGVVRALKVVPDDRRLEALEELRESASSEPAPLPQLRPDDLRSLESAGVAIGNHSVSHPILPMCSDEKLRSELEDSHATLESALGRAPSAFAYPNGDWDERCVLQLDALGYEAAFTFDHRHSAIPPRSGLAISRLWVNSTDPLDRFRIVLSGLQPALYRLRTRVRSNGSGRLRGEPPVL